MFFLPPSRSSWVASPPLLVWGCGGLLALFLLTAPLRPATAQVSLQLLHRVDSTGQNPFEGRPLPPQTEVILLRHSADRPHTLERAGIPREKLARLILTRLRTQETSIRLEEEGKTPRRYAPTAKSGRVLYILARTPDRTLYESYVNTGDGFVPGFDAVQSGRMTMGPVVPRKARRRFRAVFRIHREETASASDTTSRAESSDTAGTRTGPPTGGRAPDSSSARASASQDASANAPSASQLENDDSIGPVWAFLLGGLVGGLTGSGGAWWYFSERLRRSEEDRDELRRKLREVKNQEFREATGTTLSTSSENGEGTSADGSSSELERLRKRNETLKRQIQEIKQYLQDLEDSDE